MSKLTTEITAHGTIINAMESRFGGYYWQAHRDVLGTGQTTLTSMITSGTEETLEAALKAARSITEDFKPAPAERLVQFL